MIAIESLVRTLIGVGVTLLAGCAGTVIVDYSVDADVGGRDATGAVWHAQSHQIGKVPRPPGILTLFDSTRFRGDFVEWTFSVGTLGFGGSAFNSGADPWCLEFGESRVESNFRQQGQPLTVYHYHAFADGKHSRRGSTDPKQRYWFSPPQLCLAPGKRVDFSMAPELASLFPSSKMFNVEWQDHIAELTDRGIENWIRLSIPVWRGTTREVLEVKLTARDSRARISHY